MTTSSEETVSVKRYRLSYTQGVIEDRGDGRHHPATTSQPMVLASAHDLAIAERDAHIAAQRAEIDRLAGSLAACGVIASCDDAESFNKWAITPDNPYWTHSLSSVTKLRSDATDNASAVVGRDRLRQRVAELEGAIQGAINYCHECKGTGVVAHDCEDGIVRDNCQTCAPLRLALSGEK